MKPTGVQLQFIGYRSLKRALNQVAPDMRKAMDAEIGTIIKPIQAEAKRRVPQAPALSGWARSPVRQRAGGGILWNPRASSRIKIYQPTRGLRAGSDTWLVARRLVQGTAAGAIFTYAGSANQNQSPSAIRFRRNLTSKHGSTGRGIYSAYDKFGGPDKVQRELVGVMNKWASRFEAQLQNLGSD